MDGILIAIEGIDGSGKTTQVDLLGGALSRAGEAVRLSKEPTSGEWGQKIRESAKTVRMPLEEEIEAFRRDRMEHVETLIQPALDAGDTIILDRYFYSFVAYQGARGADAALLWDASKFAPVPDVVFLLDIDPRVSLMRIAMSRGIARNTFEENKYLSHVRERFKGIADDRPNIVVIDGTRSIVEVQRTIAQHLLGDVLSRKRCSKSYGCDDPIHCVPRMAGECRWYQLRSIVPPNEDMPALRPAGMG